MRIGEDVILTRRKDVCCITTQYHSSKGPSIAAARRESERSTAQDLDTILGVLDISRKTSTIKLAQIHQDKGNSYLPITTPLVFKIRHNHLVDLPRHRHLLAHLSRLNDELEPP
jgi:hypothetical protein